MTIQFSLKEPVVPIATAPEHLKFVTLDDPGFRSAWIDFLGLLPMYGYAYHPAVFEYYKMMSAPCAIDLTFIVRNDRTPVALVPLMVEHVNGRLQGSYSKGEFLPHPIFHPKLGSRQLRALEAFLFQNIIAKLKACGATRWYVESNILSVGTDALEDQMLSRFGGLDVSIQCHVMDLTQKDEGLWNQIRHSSKSLINKGLKTYEFKVYEKTNFTFEVGERHRLLHHKCAGRITRPIPTFRKMYSWVQEDCGLMFEQRHKAEVVQMIFVALGKHTASGASAADDPDFKYEVPLTHSMNYFIYREVQKRGVKYYNVGETSFRDTLFNMRTEKEKAISSFKRGFGKQTLPWKRWIWFSSGQEELIYLDEQLAKYKQPLIAANP
jgi:hypothetical protein